MSLARRRDEARLAVMLLTRLPVGTIRGDAPDLPASRWAWPLVGLLTGSIGWAVMAMALAADLGASLAALLGVAAMVIATGAMHHDGLADSADGLWGGHDTARRLEIMRDSRIGSYGVLALIFAVGLEWQAIMASSAVTWTGFALIAVASRLAMMIVSDLVPNARSDGLGRSAHGGGRRAWLPGGVAALLLCMACGGWLALLAIAAIGAGVATVARRKIGGQTGDILGAVQVLSAIGGWIAL